MVTLAAPATEVVHFVASHGSPVVPVKASENNNGIYASPGPRVIFIQNVQAVAT